MYPVPDDSIGIRGIVARLCPLLSPSLLTGRCSAALAVCPRLRGSNTVKQVVSLSQLGCSRLSAFCNPLAEYPPLQRVFGLVDARSDSTREQHVDVEQHLSAPLD
jgi:hypothetical protein